MNDTIDRSTPPASAVLSADRQNDTSADTRRRIDAAQGAGAWMAVAGMALALLFWIATAAILVGSIGLDAISSQPTPLIIGGAIAIVIPGLLLVMAGYMARTNARGAAANAIVLEAASRLMAPARDAGEEGLVFAEQMKQSASEVDRAMAHALSAMKAMAGEIGDERMRLESVSYASADNARELTKRLSDERTALESLTRELKAQINELNTAIPRQAALMVDSAKAAGEEVAKADEALEGRLANMQVAGDMLGSKLTQLDRLAEDASQRTEKLTFAVSRVEEKLEQSHKMVEAAVRAGEIAAAAASTTGDALKDAVSSALEGARSANTEINASTRGAAEDAARALAELRAAGEQASIAIKAAGNAARAETDLVERRLVQVHSALGTAVNVGPSPSSTPASDHIHNPAPVPAPRAPEQSYRPAAPVHTNGHDAPESPFERRFEAEPEAPPLRPERPAPANGQAGAQAGGQAPTRAPEPRVAIRDTDEDLFDAGADALAAATMAGGDDPFDLDQPFDESSDERPLMLRRRFDDPPVDPSAADAIGASDGPDLDRPSPSRAAGTDPVSNPQPGGIRGAGDDMGWRDILSDIDQESAPERSREEVAEDMIERLQGSGIRLPETFRPKAKRKIASAARKGDKQRRAATLGQAGRQVDRVTQRLKADRDLMVLARSFVTLEESDALNALEQTQKTNRNASARLAAFLLLDAAGV